MDQSPHNRFVIFQPVLGACERIIQDQEISDLERVHLYVVHRILSGRNVVEASSKPLNRYSVQPGKIFGTDPKNPQKYKVLRLIADDVIFQDLQTQKVETVQIDRLLKDWATRGLREISLVAEIIQTVRKVLGPVLGIFLTTALISWLMERLG